jgi:hypothetical protein
MGDLGDGNEDEWLMAYGLLGTLVGVGRWMGPISTGARSLLPEALLSEAGAESVLSFRSGNAKGDRKMTLGSSSSTMTLSCRDDLERSARTEPAVI